MDGWLVLGIFLGVVAVVSLAQNRGWIDLSNKNRSGGSGGGIGGIGDEVFHPTRFEAQVELDRQTILPAPAPVPGDGDKGIFGGRVEIRLPATAPVEETTGGRRRA
ncbi:hypothetical protein EYE40_13195 [Glaciihabitans arcticus]|uniref:Uncharacterized protein n=1 Tax=Glaciihabitans arcticus TaxID=2668039 RepID=A0A4Q9GVK4_9MICO|nr:hypothetical protein [Glaciihabitans arcticus]TBN58274.1 hypothetical protein EYE40_13195 [Glaciihabitans arcticus]